MNSKNIYNMKEECNKVKRMERVNHFLIVDKFNIMEIFLMIIFMDKVFYTM